MNRINYILLVFFSITILSCRSHSNCKPETNEYLFHNQSVICKIIKDDSVGLRFRKNMSEYENKFTEYSSFLIDGSFTVFEYNFHTEKCHSEPYSRYFVFQIPSYLQEFKVEDKNLQYLNCSLGQTCQMCYCDDFDWVFNKGVISGSKTSDSTWYIRVDVISHCNKVSSLQTDSKMKYKANYIIHKGRCSNYIKKEIKNHL